MSGERMPLEWAKYEAFYDKEKTAEENLKLWASLKIAHLVKQEKKIVGYFMRMLRDDAKKLLEKRKAP